MEYQKTTPPDELKNRCSYCGNFCNGYTCSDYCTKADISENCRE